MNNMTIELGDNGLRQRYWWKSYEVTSNDPALAAYQAVRQSHTFLTDDNHTWEAVDYGKCRPEYLKLKSLTQSSRYSIVIYHKEPQGPFQLKYWFHLCYRVPGESY